MPRIYTFVEVALPGESMQEMMQRILREHEELRAENERLRGALRQARVYLASGRTVGNDIAGMALRAENVLIEALAG